jgi:hypothetical protein
MDIDEDLDLLYAIHGGREMSLVGAILCSYCFLFLWINKGLFYVCIYVVHIKEER